MCAILKKNLIFLLFAFSFIYVRPGVYARVSRAHDWIKTVVCDTWKASASFCIGNGGGGTDTGGNCASGKMEFDFTVRTDNYG